MKIIHDNIRWLVAALLISALPAVAEVRDTLEFDISGSSSESITVDGETFKLYTLPDCDLLDQTGAPMLPVKYIRLSVPYNATGITVTGAGPYTQSMTGDRIYPAPVPIPTDGSVTEAPDMVLDSAIYMTDAYWPACPVELVGDGFYMGENHIVTIAVYPMLYNPVTSQMRSHSQVRLTVSYTQGDTPGNMLVRLGGDLRQQEQLAVKAMVSNPMQVEQFAIPMEQAQHMPPVGLLPDSLLTDTAGYGYGGELQQAWGDRARYLIVTTRELAPSFKRLAALKRQKGYSVQIKCIEDILADPRVQQGDVFRDRQGNIISAINDDAGKLRQYLKLAHAFDNTQFVLLAGKPSIGLPFRYLAGYNIDDEVPSDTYYTDLSTLWHLYNDSVAQCSMLENPYLPEIYVGRLSVTEADEVDYYTDKLLRYELNPGHGANNYLKSALYTQVDWMQDKEHYANKVAKELETIFPDSIVVSAVDDHCPTGSDLINLMNSHDFGYLCFHAHGSPIGMEVNHFPLHNQPWTSGNPPFGVKVFNDYIGFIPESLNTLEYLDNKYNPYVVYAMSCTTMPFDRPNDRCYSYNVGEAFTLFKDKGAVGYVGYTRDGHRETSFSIERAFHKYLYFQSKKIGYAVAHSLADCSKIGNHDLRTQNLFGDPELNVWTDIPVQLQNIAVIHEGNRIVINNLPQNDSLLIAVLHNNGTPVQYKSNCSQCVISNVNPNSTVMVYHKNYLPYIAPLYLQNERITSSQFVIANEVYAGSMVDSNRATGELIIASGVEFEIDAKDSVTLAPGFKVEKGALFSVTQSDY